MKTLQELINLDEPAWELIQEWLNNANKPYEIIPKNQEQAEQELLANQVTTRSSMGAIIYETGGMLIDNGWLRILGSGGKKLNRTLSGWNKGKSFENIGDVPSFLLIADDVLGGYFAINGGGLGDNLGMIYYFDPDLLAWEDLNITYSHFIEWALTGDLEQFYQGFRWQNWQDEAKQLDGNQVFSFFPFLSTQEGKEIDKVSRKVISIQEYYSAFCE
ncbi:MULTISPECIES: DUF2625 domain-containing protein [unclassified Moraxella]|uniref:DUF2625 domain-containing protein n=1 Tax=unclassified Moraxella TaxID=2685852 RepID=UPI002B4077DE|nr:MULTISPECIES: DUF2625 domain-containing protein [unclassified Moraxella]